MYINSILQFISFYFKGVDVYFLHTGRVSLPILCRRKVIRSSSLEIAHSSSVIEKFSARSNDVYCLYCPMV